MATAKKIVVCGGNGFLGSRICKSAVARGWDVTSIRLVQYLGIVAMNLRRQDILLIHFSIAALANQYGLP
jgi:nucleoside-diphosphate-sugar epimerase